MTSEGDETWFHGRRAEIPVFSPDRPAFFASSLEDVSMWAGRGGYVAEAELEVRNPIDDSQLRAIALGMGLEDVYSEGFADFPDVSSYLYNPRIRRKLEELGFDAYRGEDGYLFVTVVWNPAQIRIVDCGRYSEVNAASRAPAP